MPDFPICPEDCDQSLPPVNFSDCEPDIDASEIEEIFLASADADNFTDWTDAAEWYLRLAQSGNVGGNKIRRLMVVGDKPNPTNIEKTISGNRKVVINKIHTLNFDVDETNGTNYEALRLIQCGGSFKMWYKTRAVNMYGGNAGITVTIDAFDILQRGDEVEKFQYTATWKNIHDPARLRNFSVGEATMSMPVSFAASIASGHSVLTWASVTTPVAATNYIVKKNGVQIYSGNLLTFDATGLTNGTSYSFTVIAQAAGVADSEAAVVTVTPTLSTLSIPTGMSATAGDATASVAFTLPAGATGAKIYRNTTNSSVGATLVNTFTTSPASITGLTNNTQYYFFAKATGTGFLDSAFTASVNATPLATLTAPTSISAASHHLSADLTFTLPGGATGAKVYQNTSNTTAGATLLGTFTSPHTVTGLTDGTPYYFFLKSAGAGYFDSAFSSSVTATPASANVGKAELSFIGDSITAGVGVTDPTVNSYPAKLISSLDTSKFSTTYRNYGSAGSKSGQWLVWMKYRMQLSYNPASSRNTLFIMLGVNDKTAAVPLATFKANMTALCQLARHNGFKVVLMGPSVGGHNPATAAVTTGYEFDFIDWAIANQATLGYTAIIDIARNANVGQSLTANAAYWLLESGTHDEIHYGIVGYGLTGGYASITKPVAEAIEAIESIIYAAPAITQNTGARTVTVTPASGTTYSDYEYTLNNGWDFADMPGNSITLDATVAYQPGQVGIRRKTTGDNVCSPWTWITSTFTVSSAGLTPEYVGISDVRWTYSIGGSNWTKYLSSGYLGNGTVDFLQSGSFQEASLPASINFTKGVKVTLDSNIRSAVEVYVDDVLVATVDSSTASKVVYEAYPNTGTTKVLKIKAGITTGYLVGATVFS